MRHVVLRRFSSRSTIPLLVSLYAVAAPGLSSFAQTEPARAPASAADGLPAGTGFTVDNGTWGATAAPAPQNSTAKAASVPGLPKPAVPAKSNEAPTVAELAEYPLAPGDVIGVNVVGHPEMSGPLPITEAGKITLPTLGNLTVAGKTIAQAEKQITTVINAELFKPEVTVTLVSALPRQVLVIGSVRAAGTLNLRKNWRVSEAIDMSGGLVAEPDDLIATLVRGKNKPQTLDLAKIVEAPGSAANITLKPGDILRFNLLPGRIVTVAGDVKSPATITLRRNSYLLDALVGAGGLVQKPDTSKITLVRGGREIPINAVKAFEDRSSLDNAPLFNGDLIMVQAIRTDLSIVALRDEVRNAGRISIEGRPHIMQAMLAADLTTTPDKVDISIRRGAEKIPVDLQKAAYDPAFDVPLESGDVILVSPPGGPTVRVAGGVGKPGPLTLNPDATLMDAIFASGGLQGKPEDVKLSILRQTNGRQSVLSVDPVGLISLRDLGQNVKLADGDLIMVNPIQTKTVFISGQVTNPGSFPLQENDGLVELVLRAGGQTPFAQMTKVQVLRRDNTTLTVDMSKATDPGAERLPVALEPGDLVTVPKNPNQVLVMNAVQRPGYIPIPETKPLTIGDAILMAGGTQGGARLNMVALVRRGPNDEINRQIIAINDVDKERKKGQPAQLGIDTKLQPGDIVYVPEAKASRQKFQSALGTLTSVAVLRTYFNQF